MNTYKIKFDYEIEVDCEEENINDEVLNWIMQNGLYPIYRIEKITEGDNEEYKDREDCTLYSS